MFKNNMAAVIARPKLNGMGEHFGVYVGNGVVAHNTNEEGSHFTNLREFSKGKVVRIVEYINDSVSHQIHLRAAHEIAQNKKYDLISNNCETFANRVAGNKPESAQINFLGILALVILVLTNAKY